MATIRLEDTSGNTVDLNLVFEINPLAKNGWIAVGRQTWLPVDHGTWESFGAENRIEIRNASGGAVAIIYINVAVSLSDPFSSVNRGDTGEGLLASAGDPITWTLLAK